MLRKNVLALVVASLLLAATPQLQADAQLDACKVACVQSFGKFGAGLSGCLQICWASYCARLVVLGRPDPACGGPTAFRGVTVPGISILESSTGYRHVSGESPPYFENMVYSGTGPVTVVVKVNPGTTVTGMRMVLEDTDHRPSPFWCPAVVSGCACNADVLAPFGPVNVLDVITVIECATDGPCNCTPSCDVNCDGRIDLEDINSATARFQGYSAAAACPVLCDDNSDCSAGTCDRRLTCQGGTLPGSPCTTNANCSLGNTCERTIGIQVATCTDNGNSTWNCTYTPSSFGAAIHSGSLLVEAKTAEVNLDNGGYAYVLAGTKIWGIPAATEWGLLTMSLLLATGATMILMPKRARPALA